MKILIIIFFSLFFSLLTFAQKQIHSINRVVENAVQKDIFNGVVLIADKENILYTKAFGNADWTNKKEAKPETRYNLGSIGKLFTRILIMQLVQEGQLKLNSTLKETGGFYNDERDEKITIKKLLLMSAGLGDYFRIPAFNQNPMNFKEVGALVELIKREPLLYEPGTGNEYSNSGYVLLGYIIEKLTGKSYYDNLSERILRKLDMKNTGFVYADENVENKAIGYEINYKREKVPVTVSHLPTPAGGMYSTVEDLFKLHTSLVKDNVLLDDKHKLILLSGIREDIKVDIQTYINSSDFSMGYAGGSPGWNAVYLQNVNGKYTIIVLSNFDQGAEPVASTISNILQGKNYEPLKQPLAVFVYETIKQRGADYFDENYKTLFTNAGYMINNDRPLNSLGYDLLGDDLVDEAISVFKINNKLFPRIANTFDSLAEAYLAKGDKDLALENYEKAFELRPDDRVKLTIENLKAEQ